MYKYNRVVTRRLSTDQHLAVGHPSVIPCPPQDSLRIMSNVLMHWLSLAAGGRDLRCVLGSSRCRFDRRRRSRPFFTGHFAWSLFTLLRCFASPGLLGF